MTENTQPDLVDPQQPGTITGYRQHTQDEIDAVNGNKEIENKLGDWITGLRANTPGIDQEWVKTAVTHFQQGFMALNRAIFQPESRLK